ncbi:tetratricopeptide repeat protein [Bacteroidota bacterium]
MMKNLVIILMFLISVVASDFIYSQRGGDDRVKRIKTERKGRINRVIVKDKRNNEIKNPQRTVKRRPYSPHRVIPLETQDPLIIKETNPGYCIVKHPYKYNFPDRIYEIAFIEQFIQKFVEGDYNGAIQWLNEKIETDYFNPDLFFLRARVYLKIREYYDAKRDFFTVKVLDPWYPNLYYYIRLTDSLLNPRKYRLPVTR